MKNTKSMVCILLVITLLLSLSLTACSSRSSKNKKIDDTTQEGLITSQTSTIGIDSSSKEFESQLVSGTFYIVHEGIYYPAFLYNENSNASDDTDTIVDPNRMLFYTLSNANNVPTLFPGDHLVYYSTDNLLDYITWERYYDYGYTIGLHNLKKTTAGRYYIDYEEENEETPTIADSELSALDNLGVNKIMIDKLGGEVITDNVVDNGIIVGTMKNHSYNLEVYTGTTLKTYETFANIWALKAYELYASINFDTLQQYFWEIEVPDYLLDGYYRINNGGLVRIIKEDSFSDATDFNKQLIFPVDEWATDKDAYIPPRMYSECHELNSCTTVKEGTFGYVDPEAETETETETTDEKENLQDNLDEKIAEVSKFKDANVKEYELWFPKGKSCTITINSSAGETTGLAEITFESGATSKLAYNRFDDIYETVIEGKGNLGVLKISGFWKGYDVNLTNAEIYKNQNSTEISQETTTTEESKTTTN